MSSLADTLSGMVSVAAEQVFGETVTIARGTASTTGVTASWIRHRSQVIDPYVDAPATQVSDRRWLVAKAAYTISGSADTPRAGDRLTDDAANAWEILPDGEVPAVRTHEDSNYWQIATKQVT